jgi:hypothetical protein
MNVFFCLSVTFPFFPSMNLSVLRDKFLFFGHLCAYEGVALTAVMHGQMRTRTGKYFPVAYNWHFLSVFACGMGY